MKKDYKLSEHKETAEEIRRSTMPKSVTTEMVGGTMSGIIDALADVMEALGGIPTEHVKVKVKAYDGEGTVSVEGAKVEVEVFSVGGFPTVQVEKRDIDVDENGIVEFDVPHGFCYAVQSKLDGFGASFQLVQEATSENRLLRLWHLPVGIWAYGQAGICTEKYYGPSYPLIRQSFEDDLWDENDWVLEDLEADGEYEEYDFDETCWRGILVSTAETSFVIMPGSLKEGTMKWCDTYGFGVNVPLCSNFDPDNMEGGTDWDMAQSLAREDYNGHSNSVKILRFCPGDSAARWCHAEGSSEIWYDQHNFLPSAGQLYLMWLNRDAINQLMRSGADEQGFEFNLLPYQENGQWQQPNGGWEWWWSSTQAGQNCSWVVYCNGIIDFYDSYYRYHVRAVSAFHFEY